MYDEPIIQVVITKERTGYKLALMSATKTIESRSFYSLGRLLEYVGHLQIELPK